MDGMSVGMMPGTVRVRCGPLQVMLNQQKTKARRKKRKDLLGVQMCFIGVLLMLVMGLSCLAEKAGEILIFILYIYI
jgi:hypothetical protein